MSEERKRVLNMLEEGKIDAEEAEELLSSLEESGEKTKVEDRASTVEEANFLRIIVVENGVEDVNISIPIQLVRALKGLIPGKATTKLEEKGIDIEKIIGEIEKGTFDGKLVDIEDGDSRVEIRLGK